MTDKDQDVYQLTVKGDVNTGGGDFVGRDFIQIVLRVIPWYAAILILVSAAIIVIAIVSTAIDVSNISNGNLSVSNVPLETMVALSKQQLQADETNVALSQQQKSIQSTLVVVEIQRATAQANTNIPLPTITAIEKELINLQETRNALGQEAKQIGATYTALAMVPISTLTRTPEIVNTTPTPEPPTRETRTPMDTPTPVFTTTSVDVITDPLPTSTIEGELISFGEGILGSIELAGRQNAYILEALSGDTVVANISRTSGELGLQIRIYETDGSLSCENWTRGESVEVICNIKSSGGRRILVGDVDKQKTGGYALFLQQVNSPVYAKSILSLETVSGSIEPASKLDIYTFEASSENVVVVNMTRTSGELGPDIRVYGPDGSQVCRGWTRGAAAEATCNIEADGIQTILVKDVDGKQTGSYNLFLQFVTVSSP